MQFYSWKIRITIVWLLYKKIEKKIDFGVLSLLPFLVLRVLKVQSLNQCEWVCKAEYDNGISQCSLLILWNYYICMQLFVAFHVVLEQVSVFVCIQARSLCSRSYFCGRFVGDLLSGAVKSGDLLSGAVMSRGLFDGVVLTGPICRGPFVGAFLSLAVLTGYPFNRMVGITKLSIKLQS